MLADLSGFIWPDSLPLKDFSFSCEGAVRGPSEPAQQRNRAHSQAWQRARLPSQILFICSDYRRADRPKAGPRCPRLGEPPCAIKTKGIPRAQRVGGLQPKHSNACMMQGTAKCTTHLWGSLPASLCIQGFCRCSNTDLHQQTLSQE